MVLGVILFFDGALLALGNVRAVNTPRRLLCHPNITGAIRIWPNLNHRSPENVLLLRAETKDPGDYMLPGWDHFGLPEVAIRWNDCGDVWFPESLRVRRLLFITPMVNDSNERSDFFPVILTFLRQLPFIGTFLTLPYVRDVSSVLLCGFGG